MGPPNQSATPTSHSPGAGARPVMAPTSCGVATLGGVPLFDGRPLKPAIGPSSASGTARKYIPLQSLPHVPSAVRIVNSSPAVIAITSVGMLAGIPAPPCPVSIVPRIPVVEAAGPSILSSPCGVCPGCSDAPAHFAAGSGAGTVAGEVCRGVTD